MLDFLYIFVLFDAVKQTQNLTLHLMEKKLYYLIYQDKI